MATANMNILLNASNEAHTFNMVNFLATVKERVLSGLSKLVNSKEFDAPADTLLYISAEEYNKMISISDSLVENGLEETCVRLSA